MCHARYSTYSTYEVFVAPACPSQVVNHPLSSIFDLEIPFLPERAVVFCLFQFCPFRKAGSLANWFLKTRSPPLMDENQNMVHTKHGKTTKKWCNKTAEVFDWTVFLMFFKPRIAKCSCICNFGFTRKRQSPLLQQAAASKPYPSLVSLHCFETNRFLSSFTTDGVPTQKNEEKLQAIEFIQGAVKAHP